MFHFQIETTTAEFLFAFILVVLLLSPILSFLLNGWMKRKVEILSGRSGNKDDILSGYFKKFHPDFENKVENVNDRFDLYYDSLIGRKDYLFPLFLLIAISSLAVSFCVSEMRLLLKVGPNSSLALQAAFALSGAYVWILYDQISRWWYSDLSPGDLYWASFRLIVALPAAYAVSQGFAPNFQCAVAFALGTFPTTTFFSIIRKTGREKFNLGEGETGLVSELQKLDDIDFRKAERFLIRKYHDHHTACLHRSNLHHYSNQSSL